MTGKVQRRLDELGIVLPDGTTPGGNYLQVRDDAGLLCISGQIARTEGTGSRYVGRVGEAVSVEMAREAARICALNILAQLNVALEGDLDRLRAVMRVRGYVNAAPSFTDHARVIDGASDLLVEVLGDVGRHARTAIGVGSLPQGVAVEVDADFHV